MPAQTTPLSAKDIVVTAGGSLIGGQEEGTLNFNQGATEIQPKTASWGRMQRELIGATLDVSGFWWEGQAGQEADTEGFGASLGLRDLGGTSYTSVNGLDTLTITINLATYDRSNQDNAGWIVNVPDIPTAQVSATADYIDPNASSGSANEKLFAAFMENRTDIEFRAGWGEEGSQITGAAMPQINSLAAARGDDGTLEYVLNVQGAPTNEIVNVDAGLGAAVDALFASPIVPFQVEMGVLMDKTAQPFDADYTKFSGEFFPSSIEITIPSSGAITTDISLLNAAAVTREVVPAAT